MHNRASFSRLASPVQDERTAIFLDLLYQLRVGEGVCQDQCRVKLSNYGSYFIDIIHGTVSVYNIYG